MLDASGSPLLRKGSSVILAAAGLAAALAFATGCGRTPDAQTDGGLAVPDFRLASLEGGSIGPSSFNGEIVVFDFWATWCLPCHVQADILTVLHSEFDGRGVEFVAVNVGEIEAQVRDFVRKRPFPYPVLLDPADEVSTLLGIYGLPTVMVLNHLGEVAFLRTGISSESDLRRVLEGLVRDANAGEVAAF